MVAAVVKECRLKEKSMTIGVKLPPAYVKITKTLRCNKETALAPRHKLSLTPKQRGGLLQQTCAKQIVTSARTSSSSKSRSSIFKMYTASETQDSQQKASFILSSQELDQDGAGEKGSKQRKLSNKESTLEEGEGEDEEDEEDDATGQNDDDDDEEDCDDDAVPAGILQQRVPKPYTDWSKPQVKRITKKGLEVAELKPDGSTGFMVASFPNDPAISTRTEIPITM
jgi:hypothetical protein